MIFLLLTFIFNSVNHIDLHRLTIIVAVICFKTLSCVRGQRIHLDAG